MELLRGSAASTFAKPIKAFFSTKKQPKLQKETCHAKNKDMSFAQLTSKPTSDPFLAAGYRLRSLLSATGDGEEEEMGKWIYEQPTNFKIQTTAVVASGVALASMLICSLCKTDPWGGLNVSFETVQAAAVGALVAIPCAALHLWYWSPAAQAAIPSLQDMHASQVKNYEPWFSGLSSNQLLLYASLDVIGTMLLLFPAGQGSIIKMFDLLAQHLEPLDLSAERAAALSIVTLTMAISSTLEISVSDEEKGVVHAALENADRYYRNISFQSGLGEPQKAAQAFKLVASLWLEARTLASYTAGIIAGIDTMIAGTLWYTTDNLAAALVMGIAVFSVDCHQMKLAMDSQQQRSSKGV